MKASLLHVQFLHMQNIYCISRFVVIVFVAIFLFNIGFLHHKACAASISYNNNWDSRYLLGNSTAGGSTSLGGANTLVDKSDSNYSSGNTVIAVNGNVDNAIYGGYFYGTINRDAASNSNNVTINTSFSGRSGLNIYGGYAVATGLGSMTANENTVTLNGGTADRVYGGFAESRAATANNNTVTMSGGSVTAIYGGYADVGSLAGIYTTTASGNSVNISGGTVGAVYGGFVDAPSGVKQATNNIVTISSSHGLSSASLYGGSLSGGATGDAFTGNTLNIKTSALTLANIYNFQNVNFYLPSTVAAGDTILTVTGTADLTGSAGRSSSVNVGINGSASPLSSGDTITLINAGTLVTNSGLNTKASGKGMQGVSLLYNFDITTNGNKLLATVATNNGVTVNEQTKALSEGFVSGMGMVTQGADVAAGQGMNSAVSAAKAGASARGGATGSGMAPAGFGAVSGGSVRYNTGSHVDMHSLSLMTGLAWGADMAPGRLTFGPFFEYGNGSYNTYNSFSNAASVEGDGNSSYLGGGILGRMDFINTGPGHVYAETSVRAGGLRNKYESSDLRDSAGRSAEYDSSSTYYGLHFGTGYMWNITENASLDMYGKYFWTRQKGDSVTLSTGDHIDFKDVDSNRLRLGSRFSYTANDYISPYVGAAYEHEFDGKACASANGYDMKAPSMRGDTGIGEIGLVYTPSASLPLSFDFGVQGYIGKREGMTGSLQAKYEF